MKPIKILGMSGTPTDGASTDILLERVGAAVETALDPDFATERETVRLADMQFIPCQACGSAPTPDLCFYHDLDPLYQKVVECDCFLFASPIFFDNVSAQAKAFIDRCNCFRPYDFENKDPEHDFIKILPRKKRPGAMIFVGANPWTEGCRRTLVGFFRWIEVESVGMILYTPPDSRAFGQVAVDSAKLAEADELGKQIAEKIRSEHGQ